jgi:hypothetical protein
VAAHVFLAKYNRVGAVMLELLVSYAVGTVFGLWIGYKSGMLNGVEITMKSLIDQKFLLHRTNSDGEIVLIRPREEETLTNQELS